MGKQLRREGESCFHRSEWKKRREIAWRRMKKKIAFGTKKVLKGIYRRRCDEIAKEIEEFNNYFSKNSFVKKPVIDVNKEKNSYARQDLNFIGLLFFGMANCAPKTRPIACNFLPFPKFWRIITAFLFLLPHFDEKQWQRQKRRITEFPPPLVYFCNAVCCFRRNEGI